MALTSDSIEPVFKQAEPLRFLENAVQWLGEKK
jgi:hypothetical protein